MLGAEGVQSASAATGPRRDAGGAARVGRGGHTDTDSNARRAPAEEQDGDETPDFSYLHHHAPRRGAKPGDRYVQVIRSSDLKVKRTAHGRFIATETLPRTKFGRAVRSVRRVLIGKPLATEEAAHERLTKVKALAVFSSDALSSVAYATEEIFFILALAGAAAFRYALPIAIAITTLLGIVVFSYRQTVAAYPKGGGTYIVTKDNLGTYPSLIAAAALLIDYILTVAVSISSGVAAITSALPRLYDYRVELAVAAVVLVMTANLRGIRESGSIFAVPTYIFIASMFVLIGLGFAQILGLGVSVHEQTRYPLENVSQSIGAFLILRAFAAGSTAMTGVEAISDGVPAFKQPEWKNAQTTLLWMGGILGVMFLGITYLARHYALTPSPEETILSQLARTLVGGGNPFYYVVQAATALILILAANTAFADFPRLGSFLARDKFLPHQFLFRGDRLAFNTGILVLGAFSSLLVIGFGANVTRLIPLYAVGVFTSFTFSQAGMVRRWRKQLKSRERTVGMLVNGTGAITTFVVLVIIVLTKFLAGAWVVIALVPLVVLALRGINHHYSDVAAQLSMNLADVRARLRPRQRDVAAVVPVDSLNVASTRALEYAMAISNDVTAVHVASDMDEAHVLRREWDEAGIRVPLVIIESPYRSLLGPLVAFVEQRKLEIGDELLNVVLPEFVPAHLGEQLLHNQSALRLKAALLFRPGVVVTDVPYHLAD